MTKITYIIATTWNPAVCLPNKDFMECSTHVPDIWQAKIFMGLALIPVVDVLPTSFIVSSIQSIEPI